MKQKSRRAEEQKSRKEEEQKSSGGAFLELSVPAKVNLWLEVVGRRNDGYHDLSSLMLPVEIYDHLELRLHENTSITIECDFPGVPADSHNLAWRAARLYLDAAGAPCGAHIRLKKDIPAGAGMGGGSADAAAVLLGLNELLAGRLPKEELHRLARQLGADVPFFLYRRPALATGIGDALELAEGLPVYPLVLIKPPVTVSTGGVYRSLKLTRGESRIKLARFLAHPWQLREVMENDLETVTLLEYPLLTQIKDWLIQRGALGALMSGSGPTVFGVFPEMGRAREAEQLARVAWKECWVAAAASKN